MKNPLGLAAAGLAAGLVVLLLVSPARGAHLQGYSYWLEDPFYNPNGLTQPGVKLLGVNIPWMASGVPYSLCFDWNPVPEEVLAAVNDWEQVLPGAEFNNMCSSVGGVPFGIRRSGAGSAAPPNCRSDVAGCAYWSQFNVPQYNGIYVHSSSTPELQSRIWVNDIGYDPTPTGLRYLVAHELGHIFGLHEAYLHDPDCVPAQPTCDLMSIQCNDGTGGIDSVEDMFEVEFGRIVRGCDGESPTTRDIPLVQGLYATALPTFFTAAGVGPDLLVDFFEDNHAESGYGVLLERIVATNWELVDTYALYNTIAPVGHRPDYALRKAALHSDGIYRVCMYPFSAEYPPGSLASCSPGRYLNSNLNFDRDGDGFSDRMEAGTPRCQDGVNSDAADDSSIDDGCPAYGAHRELGDFAECDDLTNDDVGDDTFVNDGCPVRGSIGEGSFTIGTNHEEVCSADSIANNEDLDAWPPDFNDDQSVTGVDLSSIAAVIGLAVPQAPARRDIAPDPMDGAITGADLSRVAAKIGTTCTMALAPGGVGAAEGTTLPVDNPGIPIYAIDTDPGGTISGTIPQSYSADPDGNGTPEDNILQAGTADFCIQVPSLGNRQINVVGLNLSDVVAHDVRLLYDPALVSIPIVNHTPFVDNEGTAVGFINLPWDAAVSGRTSAVTANSDSGAGSAFFSATYSGARSAGRSADEPHLAATEAAFPYAAGPGGVPLVRFTASLKAAAAGQVVNFDLTNSVAPGNDYVSLDPSGAEVVVPVPESNLIDGAIAVAPATCPLVSATSAGGEGTYVAGCELALGIDGLARFARRESLCHSREYVLG